jgi:hypothetical protein
MAERHAEYAVCALRRMMRSGATAVEVKRRLPYAYDRWLQRSVRDTAWTLSNNYFKSACGKVARSGPTAHSCTGP